ncbi:unnamed protein product [Pseudo-nitzschia multistriata]|uniref:Serine/threonine-protein phosphatase PGAM5, mitochondrial n=1 Tax=Pseudo-nitzschia multistriata TaxID=183589 RepID=A0A448ZIX9_9STRA|nr:unnamed protein product [Pseudo-nitzschia multistriata]
MFSRLSLARRFSSHSGAPWHLSDPSRLLVAAAAAASLASNGFSREDVTTTARCSESPGEASSGATDSEGLNSLFHGQCLKRQMRTPAVPYPLWDYNWDGRMTSDTTLEAFRNGEAKANASSRAEQNNGNDGTRNKRSRHLILVRHGQYDERSDEDKHRKLTPLGRRQAIQTGKRLVEMARGSASFEDHRFNGKCAVKAIHVSDMTRAKETAALIAEQFHGETALLREPDPMLNEALPAPMVPIRPDIKGAEEEIDENHDRIEAAFRKYFYRDDGEGERERDDPSPEEAGESDAFEVIVCHGNVIRYFFCRALQLPPEAWLRLCTFNCSITYLVVRPNGMVSARMMGDIGHLDYDESTFSGYHGFKW